MNRFSQKLFAAGDRIARWDNVISALIMFAIVAISIWGVIARYFLGNPSGWVEELTLALFVWLVFFGLSPLARRGEIITIVFALNLFPEKVALVFRKIVLPALFAASLLVIIVLGSRLVIFSGDSYTAILRIPYSTVYLGIPLGALFTLYHVLRHAAIGPRFLEKLDDEL